VLPRNSTAICAFQRKINKVLISVSACRPFGADSPTPAKSSIFISGVLWSVNVKRFRFKIPALSPGFSPPRTSRSLTWFLDCKKCDWSVDRAPLPPAPIPDLDADDNQMSLISALVRLPYLGFTRSGSSPRVGDTGGDIDEEDNEGGDNEGDDIDVDSSEKRLSE
jgi:hypothetical protein